MIDLDHNATTRVDPRVLDAMLPFLRDRYGNPSSAHGLGRDARDAVEGARLQVARCIGASPDEIIFTSGGTEADNLALRGLATKGRRLVTTSIEHHAVLRTAADLARAGADVKVVPVDPYGVVRLEELERALDEAGAVVSVMWVNNETGVIQPLEEVVRIAKRQGSLVHTDAVQALGKLPLDVAISGVDLASFSAHKVGGPKGVGALYVRRGTAIYPSVTGGAHEGGRRAGTEDVAGIVGFGAAARLAAASVDADTAREARLRDRLEAELGERLGGVTVNGLRAPRVGNTTSVGFHGIDGESVVVWLDTLGIAASTGSACATEEPEPSHVLLAMGLCPRDAQGVVRFSLGPTTTEHEIDSAVAAVVTCVARLREISTVRARG